MFGNTDGSNTIMAERLSLFNRLAAKLPSIDVKAPETWVLDPEPTVLTTVQLLRELANLREILETRIDGLEQWVAERFDSTSRQFTERDERIAIAIAERKESVRDALSAYREASNKTENSFTRM